MLRELITEDRIQVVEGVADWKAAIQLAAMPLLQDGAIAQSYVDAMIESVEKLGPYIVLDDHFALPHARVGEGVNRLSMALLVLRQAVDVLGKPASIFMPLASLDPSSHLDALHDISTLWEDPADVETLRTGTKEELLALISRF